LAKNAAVTSAIYGKIMKRESTSGLQLKQIIRTELDRAYPEGTEEEEKPKKKVTKKSSA
jgi:hypothetical protein